jgi:hypothetical protein
MKRIFFTSTLLKAGTHYGVGVRAAFFPVFSETLLILNPPCQHVFVRSSPRFSREFCGGPVAKASEAAEEVQ